MRIPPYWVRETYNGRNAKGHPCSFVGCGWSFESLDDAREKALAMAAKIFEGVTSNQHLDEYEYLTQPLREEIVESVKHDGEQIAVITRNRYGALVLNAAAVCFADVDFPPPPPPSAAGLLDAIGGLFSKKKKQDKAQSVEETTAQTIRQWAQNNSGYAFRLYRTKAGLRLLFTDRLYDPKTNEMDAFLKGLGSDPLYRKLTLKQESFRARLTPKPWRCGCRKPPTSYPWQSPDAESAYRKWQAEYERKTAKFSTCRLIETFGADPTDDHIRTIVKIHDKLACGSVSDLA